MTAAVGIITVFYESCECQSTAEGTDPVCVDLLISVWTASGNSRGAAGHTLAEKHTPGGHNLFKCNLRPDMNLPCDHIIFITSLRPPGL